MGTRPIMRCLLMVLGLLALALGMVGVLVPLLPTTPFLLLAAACFMRGSDRLYSWLTQNRWVGSYIRNYRERRAMTGRAKATALGLLWGMIGYSVLLVAESLWLRVVLVAVATGVTAHLLCLKTLVRENREASGGDTAEEPNWCRDCASPGARREASSLRGGTPMAAKL